MEVRRVVILEMEMVTASTLSGASRAASGHAGDAVKAPSTPPYSGTIQAVLV